MIERIDETIVAISSAPGAAPLGIVRLSGPRALEIADVLVSAEPDRADAPGAGAVSRHPGHSWFEGDVCFSDGLSAPARWYVFRAPRSYTRQNLVEIHTVGAPPLLEQIIRRTEVLGARRAAPGEFTARAFLLGRMDLGQAEAVARLIRARGDTHLRAARRMMDGSFSRRIVELRGQLAELLALVEAGIDFAEEPIEFISPAALRDRLDEVASVLVSLAGGSVSVDQPGLAPHVLLLGPPNAGKSTLLNALSGTDRAITSVVAGTTRDLLSAPMRVDGVEVVLLDAAGIDASDDEIIAQARALALAAAEHVDLACIVIDVTDPPDRAWRERLGMLPLPPTILVANKCDLFEGAGEAGSDSGSGGACFQSGPGLVPAPGILADVESWRMGPVFRVSAKEGTGMVDLRAAIVARAECASGTIGADAVVIGQRQQRAVEAGLEAIARAGRLARESVETSDAAELLAFEIREALAALGEVSGDVTTEDLLTHIFANFCIGK
jgi:tRNA modification GTPase